MASCCAAVHAISFATKRPCWMATGATPGSGLPVLVRVVGHVAEDEDLGMAGQRQVGLDGDAAGAVERRRRSPRRECFASGEACDAGGPDDGLRGHLVRAAGPVRRSHGRRRRPSPSFWCAR